MKRAYRTDKLAIGLALVPLVWMLGGCVGSTTSGSNGGSTSVSDVNRQYPLSTLPTSTVTVNGHRIRVWVAQEFDPARPGVIQEGLMHVPEEEIADDQGMLFVFRAESVHGFWMFNTITPLDIAYARFNGTIVTIDQMDALTLNSHSSIEPVMFALEVKQGTLAALGIKESDRMEIPDEVLQVMP